LPQGFFKVRYYGIFVNAVRKANIALANNLLSEEKNDQRMEDIQDGKQTWEKQDTLWNEIMDRIRKHSKFNCPVCKKGTMRFAGMVPPG
jgi:transcription elongation factor Elf1